MEKISSGTAPVVWTNLSKGFRQLHEAIWHGSLRLRELDKEWARLRRKNVRLDEEIRKIKSGFTKMGYANLRIRGPDLASSPTILERTATLLSWLPPHPTDWRSIERDALLDAKVRKGCPQPRLAGKQKPRTRGVTTSLSVGSPVSSL